MDDLRFHVLFTVFQLYQDDERLIMKGCVQWNPVYGLEDFASSAARTRDRYISRPALDPLSYWDSSTIHGTVYCGIPLESPR